MTLSRRTFLVGLIAAPAIVRPDSIWVPPRRLVKPAFWIDWGYGDTTVLSRHCVIFENYEPQVFSWSDIIPAAPPTTGETNG